MMPPEYEKVKDTFEIKKRDLITAVVLYGIIMWAAGFLWAGAL